MVDRFVRAMRKEVRDDMRERHGVGEPAASAARERRRQPLVATARRWAAATVSLTAASVALLGAYVFITHTARTLASFAPLIVSIVLGGGAVLCAILRAEESRLSRELRTARTGTPALRATVARRREEAPLLGRFLATKLGAAAVLLADGDRAEALHVLAGISALMRGGRLDALRAVVEADIERASGTPGRIEESVRRLRAMEPLNNREADLYRLHVLVKALLQRGDGEGALQVAQELTASRDEEERIYVVWLRAWFDLDGFGDDASEGTEDAERCCAGAEGHGDDGAHAGASRRTSAWAPLPEGELRLAALLARAQGAEKLVERIETRVAAIARPLRQE
ncbi:MAG: hypothetical protein M3O36_00215 [Myxococcota bacterium]|nr:hypothetical protein [Myxococcota bacterium]